MNSYGYDYYVPNDALYFDDTTYLESLKPLNKIENFDNDIEELLNDDSDNKSNNMLNTIIEKKNKMCNMIYENLQKCQQTLKYKSYELNQIQSQIFLVYILLVFSIIFIFYQRMNINNLNQLIYILKYNKSNISV